MAKAFRNEIKFLHDGRAVWYYWPQKFYDGWSENDQISLNTPSRTAITPELFEDVGHAGINVKFILEFYKNFENEVFTFNDIAALRQTARCLVASNGFYTHLNATDSSVRPSENAFPIYGWPDLNVIELNERFVNWFENGAIGFDFEPITAYVMAQPYESVVEINTLFFDDNLGLSKIEKQFLTVSDYFFSGKIRPKLLDK